jgi:predicted RNA-binding protein
MSSPLIPRFLTRAQGSRVVWAATRQAAVERSAERANRRVMAVKCKDSLTSQQQNKQRKKTTSNERLLEGREGEGKGDVI